MDITAKKGRIYLKGNELLTLPTPFLGSNKMVAILPPFTSPFPSSSPSPSPFHISPPSLATFHIHTIPRCQLKPILFKIAFRSTKCNCALESTHRQTDTGLLFSLFRETGIGIDEKETHALFDKNPSLISSPLDSIRSRIHSLRSVEINDLAPMILKCPSLLTASEVDPFLHFMLHDLEGKVDTSQLNRVLNRTEPRFLSGFDKKIKTLLDHGIPSEKIAHVLNNVNLAKAFCLKSVEEIDNTLIFLNRFGGSNLIVRRPMILNYDLESQLIPRIDFLLELSGDDENATGAVLFKLPAIVSYSVKHVYAHVEFLRLFAGLTGEQIFKIILGYPNVMSASRERKLRPRIEFLKQCELGPEEIFKFLIKAPLFLGLSFEGNLAYKLVVLVKIGYECKTKYLAVAMGSLTRTSCKNLQNVVGLLLTYGFSYDDIFTMSRKQPQILQYNHSSLEKKIKYLIEEMGRDVGELLAFPAFLGYKLDDRIKVRFEEKKKTLGDGMSLNKLLTVSPKRFSTGRRKDKSQCI